MQSLKELRGILKYSRRPQIFASPTVPEESAAETIAVVIYPSPNANTAEKNDVYLDFGKEGWKKPKRLPNDVVCDIVQFFTFVECAQWATVNRAFDQHTAPRLRFKLKLLMEELEETKRKLAETNGQIEERRHNLEVLTTQILGMNNRIAEIGTRLIDMNEVIEQSHRTIGDLSERLRRLKEGIEKVES